jgi:DOMON domain/Eukaryotic cytochrome b561
VVIAKPLQEMSSTNPGKYIMTTETEAGITLMDQQTLIDASFEQTDTETILRYTKLLSEDGELSIDPNGGVEFIYAAGSSNAFADHGNLVGHTFLDTLSKCRTVSGTTTTTTNTTTTSDGGSSGSGTSSGGAEEDETEGEETEGEETETETETTEDDAEGESDGDATGSAGGNVNADGSNSTSQGTVATGELDCSFRNDVPLKDGVYSLKQIVNQAKGTITVEFTFNGEGWVSFGSSPSGKMVGGEVVIAKPSEPASSTNPGKYYMSGETEDTITLMDAQTLMNASWEQANGQTILRYTKLLKEEGEVEIVPDASNTFIYASGTSNEFADHHQYKGRVILNSLTTCVAAGGGGATTDGSGTGGDVSNAESSEAAEAKIINLWVFHGILMGIAWAILIPIAIGASMLRSLIPGQGVWFKIHMFSNGTAFLLMTAAFGVAVYNTNADNDEHFDGQHKVIGLSVYVISFVQVLAGIFRPHLPKPAEQEKNDSTDEEDIKNQTDTSATPDAQETPKKSTARIAFEVGHRVVGLTLLGLAWYNCYTGIEEMVEGFGESYNQTAALWGVVGGLSGVIMLLYVYQLFTKKN